MTNIPIVVVSVIVFVACMLFGQFIYYEVLTRREAESRDLARRLGTVADKTVAPLFRLGSRTQRGGIPAWLDGLLRQAGGPYELSTLYMRIAIAAAVGALLGVALLRSPLGLICVIVGYVPVMVLSSQAETRARRCAAAVPPDPGDGRQKCRPIASVAGRMTNTRQIKQTCRSPHRT